MSLKFRLLSFLSRNTLSRKHDGILFTWARIVYSHHDIQTLKIFRIVIIISENWPQTRVMHMFEIAAVDQRPRV